MDVKENNQTKPYHYVVSSDSPEFRLLHDTLNNLDLLSVDAEWKPFSDNEEGKSGFPIVLLLQLGCRLRTIDPGSNPPIQTKLLVFLVDLTRIDVKKIWGTLKDVFASPAVIKLGFDFKNDLVYLESTFRELGSDSIFDKLNSWIDIQKLYGLLGYGKGKGLATIHQEVLKVPLPKEQQCGDWSKYPLEEEQKEYAARDVTCLPEILKELWIQYCSKESRASCPEEAASSPSLSEFERKHCESFALTDSDRTPKERRGKKKENPLSNSARQVETGFIHPPPWDLSSGGDGIPKFLCDWMLLSLAICLRRCGIDAAHSSKDPKQSESKNKGSKQMPIHDDPTKLDKRASKEKEIPDYFRRIEKLASKEKRTLLTTNDKLLKLPNLPQNLSYRVNSLKEEQQLKEVFRKFNLTVCNPRCKKCNGKFLEPLTFEEANRIQELPVFVHDQKVDFWHCITCVKVYWNVGPPEYMAEAVESRVTEWEDDESGVEDSYLARFGLRDKEHYIDR